MTNNDFDFIKQKFDESEVHAPEELNEEFVKEKIKDVQPVKVKKNRTKLIAGISVAAAVALFTINTLIFTGVFRTFMNDPETILNMFREEKDVSTAAELKTFSSRDEVKSELKNIFDSKAVKDNYARKDFVIENEEVLANGAAENDAGSVQSKSGSASGSSGGSTFSGDSQSGSAGKTYTQEEGVDEADTIKTDGEYIYYLSNSDCAISVFKANNGNTELISTIELYDSSNEMFASFPDFYLRNNKLIAIAGSYDNRSSCDLTSVCIYDLSDKKNILLEDRFYQSGYYCSSRMIGGKLYLVTSYYAYDDDCIPYCYGDEATADEAKYNELSAECIYSVEDPSESSFSVISCIDTDKSAQAVKSKAILGSAEEIYCTTENLYITAQQYKTVYYDNFITRKLTEAEPFVQYYEYTQIVKVNLNEDIDFSATAKVEGYIDDQYSLDEHNGDLRVATTSTDEEYRDVNNLYVLDEDLNELGKVTGFAKNETIRAVRYINDTAYVITYEQTDPLFIIDLSDPNNPEITGEVKISGFSSMLVPVDGKTLLGIGYEGEGSVWNGLKLVTFDISDMNDPRVIDTKVFENCSSTVQNNPKALLLNNERGDYTIPLNYADYGYTENYYSDDWTPKMHSGVLNFRIDNGKINIVDEYTSQKFGYDGNNIEVDRCTYIGDYIYMLGSEHSDYNYDYDYEYGVNTVIIDSVKYK